MKPKVGYCHACKEKPRTGPCQLARVCQWSSVTRTGEGGNCWVERVAVVEAVESDPVDCTTTFTISLPVDRSTSGWSNVRYGPTAEPTATYNGHPIIRGDDGLYRADGVTCVCVEGFDVPLSCDRCKYNDVDVGCAQQNPCYWPIHKAGVCYYTTKVDK